MMGCFFAHGLLIGAKHSYEQERDVAVAQRDVYKGQIDAAQARVETALADSITFRRQYEEMRLEKERIENFQKELIAEKHRAERLAEKSQNEVAQLIKTHDRLQLEIMNLREELVASDATKNNAIKSWEFAENHAKETMKLRDEALERESTALTQRNEAMMDRDTARELMERAKTDQAHALVCQARAERERDQANEDIRVMVEKTDKKIEYWTELVVAAEDERHNIQREIAFQTVGGSVDRF